MPRSLPRFPTPLDDAQRDVLWRHMVTAIALIEWGDPSMDPIARATEAAHPGVTGCLEDMLVELVELAQEGKPTRDPDEVVDIARFVRAAGGGKRYDAILVEVLGPSVGPLLAFLDRAKMA